MSISSGTSICRIGRRLKTCSLVPLRSLSRPSSSPITSSVCRSEDQASSSPSLSAQNSIRNQSMPSSSNSLRGTERREAFRTGRDGDLWIQDKGKYRWVPRLRKIRCPSCEVPLTRLDKATAHIKICCPDLYEAHGGASLDALESALAPIPRPDSALPVPTARPDAPPADTHPETTIVAPVIQRMREAERALRVRSLEIAFFSRDATGRRLKKSPADVAELLALPPPRSSRILKEALRRVPIAEDRAAVDVLYEDEHVIAVNKPPRVRSTPRHRFEGSSVMQRAMSHIRGTTDQSLPVSGAAVAAVEGSESEDEWGAWEGMDRPPELDQDDDGEERKKPQALVVHRLDENTSGILVFAKTPQAAASLAGQFRDRTVYKTYLALCSGCPDFATRMVDAPIGEDPSRCDHARFVIESGKPAVTEVRVIWSSSEDATRLRGHDARVQSGRFAPDSVRSRITSDAPGVSLIQCHPVTGRTHQIRVHLNHCGHPILGDDIYGVALPQLMPRQALHAYSIRFQHPVSGSTLELRAPLSPDIEEALRRLGCGDEAVWKGTAAMIDVDV